MASGLKFLIRLSTPIGRRFAYFDPLNNSGYTFLNILSSPLLPNLLSVLSDSKNEKLPIRIYEEGPVARPHLEKRLAFASMHAKASFSEIKGTVLSLFSSMGRKADIRKSENSTYVKGRCAEICVDGKKAGVFGEISPEVLSNFNLEQPVCAAELKI